MIIYPIIINLLGLQGLDAALLIGGSIHDVAQVVGAGYTLSEDIGDQATLIKLIRVAMLVPIVLLLSVLFNHSKSSSNRIPLPWFLLGFIAMIIINSTDIMHSDFHLLLTDFSKICMLAAVSALGMLTSLKKVIAVGLKPILLITLETIFIFSFIFMCHQPFWYYLMGI